MINFNFVNKDNSSSRNNEILILINNFTIVNLINLINLMMFNNLLFFVNIILMFILINNLNIQIEIYHK